MRAQIDSRRLRSPAAALHDLVQSFRVRHVWILLANQDIRQRYRRSVLGPFWISLSAIVSISALSLVYTQIFKIPTRDYLLFLTTGFVVWLFLSSLITEACTVFIGAESTIKQVNLPLGVHVLRMVYRCLLTFFHNLVIVALVLWYMASEISFSFVALIPATTLVLIAGVCAGYLLGGACARFRDIPPIVGNLMQVLFYVTPVIWPPKLLADHPHLLEFNPFYYFLELLRLPMMGTWPPLRFWTISSILVLFLLAVSLAFMARYRWRVAYWL